MKILKKLLYWFIGILAILVPAFALLMAASNYSETARIVTYYTIGNVRRIASMPGAVAGRNSKCSIGDAWREIDSANGYFAKQRLEEQSRLLQTDGDLALFSTPAGEFWIPATDRPTLFEMLLEQSRGLYGVAQAQVQPGDVVLDCGANVGVYTRTALARGASLVVAIDPASEPAECLRRNFKQEIAAGRVIVYQKGVWNTETSLELRTNPGMASTANSVAIDRGEGGEIVSLTTIDKLVEELNLERVDFIKMDIEGAESEALQGAVDTVAKFHPRMAVSLEHRPTDPDRIPVLIVELYPNYEYAFSDCVSINGSIQPDVLFLTP